MATAECGAIRRVAVVGGTHGNETNGVFLVNAYRRAGGEEVRRESVTDVQLLIGNPAAVQRVLRFVDQDLNRSFTLAGLRNTSNPSYEAARAQALNALLGPKPGSLDPPGAPIPDSGAADDSAVDFLIDFHTTTSNMGCCLMVGDEFSLYTVTYARAWLEAQGMPVKVVYMAGAARSRAMRPSIGSVAKHSVTIECGPTATGLVRLDIVTWMREAARRILDCVDCHNRGVPLPMPEGQWGAAWARGSTGAAGMPSHVSVITVLFDPKGGPAKLSPPCDEDGQPTAMYAATLQDRDFQPLRKGDPVFVGFDGEEIRYDGQFGDEVLPMFVNESGYYFKSSGLGFMLTTEEEVALKVPRLPAAVPTVMGSERCGAADPVAAAVAAVKSP